MIRVRYPEKNNWKSILTRPVFDFKEIEAKVSPILASVKANGDKALLDFTFQFDKLKLESIKVTETEISLAALQIDGYLKESINIAKTNIEKFHLAQREITNIVETMPGVQCWRKSVGINKVGLYIPGGTAPLFSTVLMLGVPAQIAGCEEVILCSPAGKDGQIHPAIIYTASLVGITNIYKLGGAQAIAAMAYGTESVPHVYKIFGPGNQYVTAAKQLVNKEGIAIDMPAGPSEVMIYADSSCIPAFVAADLLSQAEHGIDSQVILVTSDEDVLQAVEDETKKQLEKLPRKEMATMALSNSKLILVSNEDDAIEMINFYAPEHLILAIKNLEKVAQKIKNAGSVFMGNFTPESAGDYASGTNHTLPTNGHAKAYSGVSLDSFVKKITFQQISKEGINLIGPVIERMAAAEHLEAHKQAVTVRLNFEN